MQDFVDYSMESLGDSGQHIWDDYEPSKNFFVSDKIFVHFLQKELSPDAWSFLQPKLVKLGKLAASTLNELSISAHMHSPKFVKRDLFGRDIDNIIFHPSRHELMKAANQTRMMGSSAITFLSPEFEGQQYRMGYALPYILALSDSSVTNIIGMKDAFGQIMKRYANPELQAKFIENDYLLGPENASEVCFCFRENAAGLKFDAISTKAIPLRDGVYKISGEKSHCENIHAHLKLVLAAVPSENNEKPKLSIFLIEGNNKPGVSKEFEIKNLDQKLGMHSLPVGDLLFKDCTAFLLGEEGQGMEILEELMKVTNIWSSISAVAGFRRSLVEAYQYACYQTYDGNRRLLDHPSTLAKLEALNNQFVADFYLLWKTIRMMDKTGPEKPHLESNLNHLIPLIKNHCVNSAISGIGQSMKIMESHGYMEQGVIPKFIKDCLALPLLHQSSIHTVSVIVKNWAEVQDISSFFEPLTSSLEHFPDLELLKVELKKLLSHIEESRYDDPDFLDFNADKIMKNLIMYIQLSMLLHQEDHESAAWIHPAINQIKANFLGQNSLLALPVGAQKIIGQLAWGF
ncbi:hypothetical protein GCM10007049_06040 [Echinicola pacifica]|uniref:Acyl-CoA dehydrogenase n=1 Tax=Echinicola pacifica TaxID=346377 RepID=A0A918UKL9_9BACT|nr:acyl-CoA dehydrogenase family protein [Echinicola pacifica]GGZ16478.1 hypothetical protein GCM10007049_06040 [Echinicola pacifica]